MNSFIRYLLLGCIGGVIYGILEVLFRGHTHWTMLIVGGLCFVLVGMINEYLEWNTPLLLQMLYAAFIVTSVEFASGIILNVWLNLGIWDYSNQWGNILGQVCPLFFGVWFLLSLPALILDDYLRYWFLGEEKPRYKLF